MFFTYILSQVQHQNAMYKGTFDAYKQITKTEGFRGLYRGFWISCFQVVSGVCYVSTYEGVRHTLDINGIKDLRIKALVGGSCASLGEQNLTLHCLLFLRGFGGTVHWTLKLN